MSWKSLDEMGLAGELHSFIDYGSDDDIEEEFKAEDFAPEDVGMETANQFVNKYQNLFKSLIYMQIVIFLLLEYLFLLFLNKL